MANLQMLAQIAAYTKQRAVKALALVTELKTEVAAANEEIETLSTQLQTLRNDVDGILNP